MPRQPSRLAGAPVVKWLLISNIAIFFINLFSQNQLLYHGHFSVGTVFELGQFWRILTFQFLHADLGHLLFNMFALYMFGAFVEQWWGSRKFTAFYLLSGCAGAMFYSLLYLIGLFGKTPIDLGGGFVLSAAYAPAMGASAGIYACLIGVAVIAPKIRVSLLLLPMSFEMKTVAIAMLAISVVVTFTNGQNAGGEAGHLGGAILGFILMKYPRCLAFLGDGALRTGGRSRGRKVFDAKEVRKKPKKKIRPRININLDDSEVDRILDKVNREGIQSLTADERDVLKRSSNQ